MFFNVFYSHIDDFYNYDDDDDDDDDDRHSVSYAYSYTFVFIRHFISVECEIN